MKLSNIFLSLFVLSFLLISCDEQQDLEVTSTTTDNQLTVVQQDDASLADFSSEKEQEEVLHNIHEQKENTIEIQENLEENLVEHIEKYPPQEPYKEQFCFDTYIKTETQQACTKSIPPICQDFTSFSLVLQDIEQIDIKQLLDRGFKVKWAINGQEMQGVTTTTDSVLAHGILSTVSYNEYLNHTDLDRDKEWQQNHQVVDVCVYVQFRDCDELIEHCIVHHFEDDTVLEDNQIEQEQEDSKDSEQEASEEQNKDCYKVYIRPQKEEACTTAIPPSCHSFTTFSLMLEDVEGIDTDQLLEDGFKVTWAINGSEVEGTTITSDFILAQGTLGTVSYYHANNKEDTFDIKQIDVCAYVQFRHCSNLLEECVVYEF